MIYRKLIVTYQNYEVSCQDLNFVPCPMRLAVLLRVDTEKNRSIRENWRVKMFIVAGYHAVVCDAFIMLDFCVLGGAE